MLAAGSAKVWIYIWQCAWCRKVRLWRWGVRLPMVPLLHWRWHIQPPHLPTVEIAVTHGACADCLKRLNGSPGTTCDCR